MEFVGTTFKLKNVKMLNALKDILNNVNGSKVGEVADEALIVPICIQVYRIIGKALRSWNFNALVANLLGRIQNL